MLQIPILPGLVVENPNLDLSHAFKDEIVK